MRRRGPFGLVVLALGCGGSGTSAPPTSSPPAAVVSTPGSALAAPPGLPMGSASAVPSAAPRSPWAIELPRGTLVPTPAQDLWQYTRWQQKKVIPVGKSHLYVSRLSPDERHVLVISMMEYVARIYELASGRLVWRHSLDHGSVDAVFWPEMTEGLRFVVAGKDGVTLRDAVSGAVIERFWSYPCLALSWSPDEQILVASSVSPVSRRSQLVFWTRGPGHTLRVAGQVEPAQPLADWALSADNQLLVTLSHSSRVDLHRLGTGETLWSLPSPNYAGGVAISPDGAWVAAGGDHLLLIDAQHPERRSAYREFKNNINTVVFSRSNDVVIASSYDGRIRILRNDVRTATLTLIRELRHGGTANVYGLSVMRDGSGLVSASGDQTVRWWGL